MNLEITSKNNPHYKELKKLIKENTNYIFIEGKKLFEEALKSKIEIKKVFIDKGNKSFLSKPLVDLEKPELFFLNNDLLASLFTTSTKPTREDLIIALAKKPKWDLSNLFKTKKNLIFLERIQDPGNLGTIIRSALAFNAGGIILSKGSVNPFNTKVIRASAGAVFKLPVVMIDNLKELTELAKKEKYKIIAMSPQGNLCSKVTLPLQTVFLFGNEGSGLSKELLSTAHEVITIPHSKKVESLNLATAVSIVLWEMQCRGTS